MDVKVLKLLKNSRGEMRTKIVQLTNKKDIRKGIDFASINSLYEELLTKYKASNIVILAKNMDGNFATLKTSHYIDTNLKHADPDYWENIATEVRDKVCGRYYSVEITIQM